MAVIFKAVALVAATVVLWGLPAGAQEAYPVQLVRVIVPAAAGSTTDMVARLLADHFQKTWSVTVIVENIGGFAGNTGADHVARAAPDGSTLLVTSPAPLAINQFLYKNMPFKPSEFVPISLLARVPNVLLVRKTLEAQSLEELIASAKKNPDKLTYASQGVGSTAHLTAALLQILTGIKMVHVPYRGAAPALNDIIAGHVDMMFDTLATSLPLHRGGQARILAVGGAERSGALPEVPTLAEAGVPGFRSTTWFGLVAPPKTPTALAERISRDVAEALQRPEVGGRLRELMLDPVGGTPAEAGRFFAEEAVVWSKVIQDNQLSAP